MRTNMQVGPSFEASITLKTVKKIAKTGDVTYAKQVEYFTPDLAYEDHLNGLFNKSAGGLTTIPKLITSDIVSNIAEKVGKIINKAVKLFEGEGYIDNRYIIDEGTQKAVITSKEPKVGDKHLFYDSEDY